MLLNGKQLADSILNSLKTRVDDALKARAPSTASSTNRLFLAPGRKPCLAVVQVGHRPDSSRYVETKTKAASRVGVDTSFSVKLADNVSEAEVVEAIQGLNANPEVDAILVQLPLPRSMDQEKILACIDMSKDVDGFHPANMGLLARWGEVARQQASQGNSLPRSNVPCTPLGIITLLDHYSIPIAGKRAVVLGRSNIVGLPISLMLLHRDASVTVLHSKSLQVEEHVVQADIVIAAMGKPQAVKASWIKPGAAVVDVGINVSPQTGKLVGDVDFEAVSKVAGYITPVPGGVGPLTVAMLIQSTVHNFCVKYSL